MLAVDDQSVKGIGRFQRRRDRSRLPAQHRRHGVEQMGEAGEPFAHRGARLLVGRHGMSERYANTGFGKLRDGALRHLLRRERDQRDAFARLGQQRQIVRRDLPDELRIVHARPLRRNERAFQMNAEHARFAIHRGLHGIDRGGHLLRGVGDEGRQQSRRAEFAVRARDGRHRFRRRAVVEQHVAAAVHLHVDEAGREPCSCGQSRVRAVSRGTSVNGTMPAMSSPSISTAASRRTARAVEDVVRRHSLRRFTHRVRVTFRRCRG